MKTHKLQQRALSAATAAMLLFTLVPGFAAEQEEIVISSADQLIELAYSRDKSDFEKNYRLADDIDMSQAEDERAMKAIGSYSGGSDDTAFSGTFDGDGHKLINLSTSGEALFGYVADTGVIKNLTLEKASVHYRENSSSKYPAALVSLNCGDIQNCFSINSAVVSDYCSPAGGLIGTNFGHVSQSGVCGGSVSLAVSKTGTSHGGFVGNQRGGAVEECFSTAAVDAKKWAGGFVGKIEDGTIADCYALGNVNGTEECGGFAGAFMDGYNDKAVLQNVYAANTVLAVSGGGIAGGKGFSFSNAGVPENCWYCSDFGLPQNSEGFINSGEWGKTTEEMQSAEFAAMLSDKWAYDAEINSGYPYLINAVPPVSAADTAEVTAQLMIAGYDKSSYSFYKLSEPIDVSVAKSTVNVEDILSAAADKGDITYELGKDGQSGMVVAINGVRAGAYDGWMFEINGATSPVGAAAAIVEDGDKILWYLGTPENGYTAPVWEEIGAEPENVIVIDSAAALLALAAAPEKWSGSYKLSGDIDLSGVEFSPIGNTETPFAGSFDGNGFEISDLTINGDKDSRNIGMFGVINGARLKNISLKNIDITGGSVVGGLVGIAKSSEKNVSLISDCHISGSVKAVGNSYAKQTDAGGLVGVNDSIENKLSGNVYLSAIDSCEAEVNVIGDTGAADISDAGHIGGFVGLNKGTISNSSALGAVSGGNTVGGFVGSNYGGSIYSSNAKGDVSGAYTCGGFVGLSGLGSVIESSYSSGDVKALGESGEYFGGFAGSVSGKVKNCISSGTLTPAWGYNGGFAGSLRGTIWSYDDQLRSVSGCYGNSVTAAGDKIKALGSYIGGVHAPTDMAAEEIAVDKETAENKIAAMLNNAAAENRLMEEAGKYKTRAAIPAVVRENSDITALVARLNANASADSEITVAYKTDSGVISADASGYTLSDKPEQDTEETVTLSLMLDDAEYDQPISVKLFTAEADVDKDVLLKNIAEQYAENASDYWKTAVVSAYNKQFDVIKVSDKVKAELLSNTVKSIREANEDTTLAMNIIALRGLGYNPADITDSDGSKINAPQKLAAAPSTGNNGDAYRLLAYSICGYKGDTDEVIKRLVSAQIDGKGWSNNNDKGIDADTTGAVLLGLSPYYSSNAEVKLAVDKAVEYLASLMQNDGNIKSSYKESNYGTNANTSSICAIGLEALGIDIKTDERFIKNSVSLFDGIMSFAVADENGFAYEYAGANTNELSTKQAALAVMAAEKNGNILDFSDMPNSALKLNASSGSTSSGGSGGASGGKSDSSAVKTIDVYFTLVGDTVHGNEKHSNFSEWIKETKLTMNEGSSARELIEKAAKDMGYVVEGMDKGYITDISTPDGVKLGEYSNGPESGWMYMVNEAAPSVGINDYKLQNGDKIKVYYADSWNTQTFPDVKSDDWFSGAAAFVAEKGLMDGDENGRFMPEVKLTRAMAVTILYRYRDGKPGANDVFSDVKKADWFADAVSWAAENNIVSGVEDDLFAPNDSITREQLAAILYRMVNPEMSGDMANTAEFKDADKVSDWAADAMDWAVGSGIISGMDDGTLAPKSTATRAQFAAIMMRLDNLNK